MAAGREFNAAVQWRAATLWAGAGAVRDAVATGLNLGRAARRLAARLVHCQRARSVGVFRKVDADGLFGQQLLDEFGPFEQADVAGVEVIFIAHIVDFFQALYAVEIEMEDAPIGRCVVIFVDDGKGG